MLSEWQAPPAVLLARHRAAWVTPHLQPVYWPPELLQQCLHGLQLPESEELAQSHLHPCLYVCLAQDLMIGSLAVPHLRRHHIVSLSGMPKPRISAMHCTTAAAACISGNIYERRKQHDPVCSNLAERRGFLSVTIVQTDIAIAPRAFFH